MQHFGPAYLPFEISQISSKCPRCSKLVRPNLWKRFDEPFGPIPTLDGKILQRLTTVANCECGQEVHFSINPRTLNNRVEFFGDESDRLVSDWHFSSYTTIGASPKVFQQLIADFNQLKASLVSDREPNQWRVHTEEMISGSKRLKNPLLARLAAGSISTFFDDCAGLVKAGGRSIWKTTAFGFRRQNPDPKSEKKVRKKTQASMNLAMLSSIIWRSTAQGARPQVHFDATKAVKSFPHIEGWATNSYLGSRHYLAHEFLTHGNEIDPPQLIVPGSRAESELADIVAYFSGHNIFCRINQKNPRISLGAFGEFQLIVMQPDNVCLQYYGSDIPSKFVPTADQLRSR